MKSGALKITAIVSATALALLLGACSDDGSGTTNVSHGEFTIPIPDGLAEDSTEVNSSGSESKPESSESESSNSETVIDSFSVVKYDTTRAYDDIDSTSTGSSSSQSKSSSSSAKSSSSSAKPESSESKPSSSASESNDWRSQCLDIINEYRKTEDAKPLVLAEDAKQTCTDNQAASDLKDNSAHGHFGDCGEWAQNTGPNVSLTATIDTVGIAKRYLKMMWDEKKLVESGERDPEKDADYSYIGHYLNMRSAKYTKVACGFATSSDGKTGWLNINFF